MALKGIAYDNTAIQNITVVAGESVGFDGAMSIAEGLTVLATGITVDAGGAAIVGNSTITGNLTVTGNLISQDDLQVLIKDNFIDLNVGYVGTTYKQTGLTFNYQGISGKVFTVASNTNNLTFTVGDNSNRARLVLSGAAVISSGTFAVNDVLQISGTTNGENDGIYIVHANGSDNTIDVKSSTLASPDAVNSAFALLNFTAQTQNSGDVTIAIVNLMAIRASSAGLLESASGDSDTDFSSYTSVGAATTLQQAYAAGNTITTSGSNDVLFTTTSGGFKVQGSGSVLIGNSTAVSAFGVTSSGTSTITSAGNSTLRSSEANVTIQSDSGTITNTCTGATYTINATGQTVDINATTVDIDANNFQVNGSGAANITYNDDVDIISNNGAVDIDAGGNVEIDAADSVSIQGAITSDLSVVGAAASATDLSLVASNSTGAASIGLTAKSAVINTVGGSAQLTIAAATSTFANNVVFDSTDGFKVSGESVTISSIKDEDNMASDSATALATQQSIKAYVDSQISDDNLTFGDGSATGTVDLDTQTFTIAGTSNEIETVSAGQTLTVGLPAAVTLTTSLTSPLVNVGSIEAQDSTAAMTIASTTGAVAISTTLGLSTGTTINEFSIDPTMAGDSDDAVPTEKAVAGYVTDVTSTYQKVTLEASETIAVGNVVAILANGQAVKANAGTSTKQRVIGICASAGSVGQSIEVAQVGIYSSSNAFTAGETYYVNTVDGNINATAPSLTGQIVYEIGYASTVNDLIIHQRFVMEIG